ncbi:uncharacterized protein PITG_00340 [Phytophthora infestans T30-4]|uniref:Uncharacterized protein n=1 Tax=Phytophthora infestans (strain T30-4) TaxID=403677 RepID=D0MQJ8_PHYIT|nr:uncharacterized protein PITG_00340 [Phytophthora infestans T30-4]EEY57767.1 hypothetical protein PITG_00340 [Phytophthora infestans T30-4]|eukprot:XP_002908953.1 hypothetical protein PITG_00340 [Phytophthora infestans T30-4]
MPDHCRLMGYGDAYTSAELESDAEAALDASNEAGSEAPVVSDDPSDAAVEPDSEASDDPEVSALEVAEAVVFAETRVQIAPILTIALSLKP